MKIASGKGEVIAGAIVAAFAGCVMMISISERLSRQLDGVDLTWDELEPKPELGGPWPAEAEAGALPEARGRGTVPPAENGSSGLLRLRPGARRDLEDDAKGPRDEALQKRPGHGPGAKGNG